MNKIIFSVGIGLIAYIYFLKIGMEPRKEPAKAFYKQIPTEVLIPQENDLAARFDAVLGITEMNSLKESKK